MEELRKAEEARRAAAAQAVADRIAQINDETDAEQAAYEKKMHYLDLTTESAQALTSALRGNGNAALAGTAAMLRAIGVEAMWKAKQAVANALSESGKAAAATAEGNLGGAELHRASASAFWKAAAKWGVVGGASAAASGMMGGGSMRNSRSSALTDSKDKGTVTIIFPDSGILDASNPETKKKFAELIQAVADDRTVTFGGR